MPIVEPNPGTLAPPEAWRDFDPTGPLPRELWPDINELVTSDDTPVDNIYAEKQQRLLIDALYTSWVRADGKPFCGYANVGLFYKAKEPAVVSDVMFAIGVDPPVDSEALENRSYFMWIHGRPPDIVVEIVSDRRGGEGSAKMDLYHQIGVPYYVILDPGLRISNQRLRVFARNADVYHAIDQAWLTGVELGLTAWTGMYQGMTSRWLRWIDRAGQLLATGQERSMAEQVRAEAAEAMAQSERVRAESERVRAETERVRAETERARAESERVRAEDEKSRADAAEARVRELLAKLNSAGAS